MKKLVFILIMFVTTLTSYAQLNIQTVEEYANYKTVYTIKLAGTYLGEIRYINDYGFVLFGVTDNRFEEHMASVYLGKTQDEAGRSIADLSAFYQNAECGDYIVEGCSGSKTHIIIYKMFGKKGIQIKTDGVTGVSGVPSWICIKDNIYAEVLHAIYSFKQ